MGKDMISGQDTGWNRGPENAAGRSIAPGKVTRTSKLPGQGGAVQQRASTGAGASSSAAGRPARDWAADVWMDAAHRGSAAFAASEQGPVQAKGQGSAQDPESVHRAAAAGVSGSGGALPYADAIQKAFGGHDVSGVRAHVGGAARAASDDMGAVAYATGEHIGFRGQPDLHTAAHEAAHVVQQRAGVQLAGGVGRAGDAYEQHADAVADRVVRGESAESLLGAPAGGRAAAGDIQKAAAKAAGNTGEQVAPAEKTFHPGDPQGKIAALHPTLQAKARQLIQEANKRGLDVFIFDGLRSIEQQNELYAQGRSKPGKKVTSVRGGSSYHNYGLAIDVVFHGKAPWGEQHDWEALGQAGEAVGLEWGGRWSKFKDRPHFQIAGLTINLLKQWHAAGGMAQVWRNVAGESAPASEESEKDEDAQAGKGQGKAAGAVAGAQVGALANALGPDKSAVKNSGIAKPSDVTKPSDATRPSDATKPSDVASAAKPANAAKSGGAAKPGKSIENGPLDVASGQITFDAEGNDSSKSVYYSRRPHCPAPGSGVTIGRGYDMKHRKTEEVLKDLEAAGVPASAASVLAQGAGISSYKQAKEFCRKHADIEISHEAQKELFEISYGEKQSYAAGLVKKWSGIALASKSGIFQDIIVDLFYRGDLTRQKWNDVGLSKILASEDRDGLLAILQNRSLWGNVDTNRYRSRLSYVRGADAGKADAGQTGTGKADAGQAGAGKADASKAGQATVTASQAGKTGTRAASPSGEAGKPRVVSGNGDYLYRQDPDGSITIVSGPTGAGKSFPRGHQINQAITREIGPYPAPGMSRPEPTPAPVTESAGKPPGAQGGGTQAGAVSGQAAQKGTDTATTAKPSGSTQGATNADGPLLPEQIATARKFYADQPNRYPADLVRVIQAKVGASSSGALDAPTIQAIAQYQHSQGLPVDGQAGATTITKMFGGDVRMKPEAGPTALVDHDGLSGIHEPSVKLTAAIKNAWEAIQPHMPKGAVLTSGVRTWADSARILTDYFQKKAPAIVNKGFLTQAQVNRIIADKDYKQQHDWVWSAQGGLPVYKVAMPGQSRHCTGKALDISGAPLGAIEAALQKAVKDDSKVASVYQSLIMEKDNHCVHVNLK